MGNRLGESEDRSNHVENELDIDDPRDRLDVASMPRGCQSAGLLDSCAPCAVYRAQRAAGDPDRLR